MFFVWEYFQSDFGGRSTRKLLIKENAFCNFHNALLVVCALLLLIWSDFSELPLPRFPYWELSLARFPNSEQKNGEDRKRGLNICVSNCFIQVVTFFICCSTSLDKKEYERRLKSSHFSSEAKFSNDNRIHLHFCSKCLLSRFGKRTKEGKLEVTKY